jgi:hypothetical protein
MKWLSESQSLPKANPLAVQRVHDWRMHWRWEELIGQSEVQSARDICKTMDQKRQEVTG